MKNKRNTAPSMTQSVMLLGFFRDLLLILVIPFALEISFLSQYKSPTDVSGNILNQLMALFVFGGSLFLARFNRTPLRTTLFSMMPLAGVLLLALVSVLWSDYPPLTIRRSFHLVIETVSLVLIGLAYRDKPEKLVTRLFYIFGIITLADAASLAVPSMSLSPFGFMGIHDNKNEAGDFFLCAIPIFAMSVRYHGISNMRLAPVLLLLIASSLFAFTQSKTSIACVLTGIPLTLALRLMILSKGYGRFVVPLICLAFGSAVLLYTYDVGLDTMLDKIFGDSTLTGRPDIWQFALTKFYTEPLNGIGYGALWQTGPSIERYLSAYNVIVINEAHNGYIDILAQLGILGIVFTGVFLIVVFIRLCRSISHYEDKNNISIASYALYLFISASIYNLTESSFFRPGISQWVILVMVSACATASLARRPALILKRRSFAAQFRTGTISDF